MSDKLEASAISVSLGGKPVLKEVDFLAGGGEMTAIIGPNGSGKTTLLRALSGDVPASGVVRMNGLDVLNSEFALLARHRAVLPQSIALAFPFTVLEIVRMGLQSQPRGLSQGYAPDLPGQALAKVGLAGFEGRIYQQLSGGEQQRVQLARVLVQIWEPCVDGVPRWLLLDEPVSSLDVRHQLSIMKLAREYARAGGGVVAVLHDLNLTSMFAEKVYLMDRGQVAASGSPSGVISDKLLAQVFECKLKVGRVPARNMPFVLPQSAGGI